MLMEFEFIDWLRKRLPDHPSLVLGPGDDAAILNLGRHSDCVVTSDLLTDQVDFDLRETDAARIGRKALAVNLSDLAAMAAEPVAAIVSLALPRDGALALAKQLYEGLLPLAEDFQLSIAGGDTNCWNGPLALSITAIGRVTSQGPFLRSMACPGDELIVTGCLGGSILGKHLDFNPRVNEALLLNKQYDIHAAIDISDGLSLDLFRLVSESGCGAEIQLDQIPVSEPACELAQMKNNGQTPLAHALSDGEDFELILAVPRDEAARLLQEQPLEVPLTRIGRCINDSGLWSINSGGVRAVLPAEGFEHGV
ncbi:MAG: thiamine-monophosphate kinase [Planctomycetaceae bacterium]|nr:thiamine-monophosphate kinase [Planctomycetaceae bacterium]MBP62317.1 thiamine-monophosphate kinase [Planctomycetaceae bacterium]